MVSVDTKTQTSTSSSPLKISVKGEEEAVVGLSFSQLLKGAGSKESDDEKIVQNGALVLSLNDDKDAKASKSPKHDILTALLKGDEILKEDIEVLELNPKVTSQMSVAELKTLIKDAKNYLKDQIINSEGFKKSEVEALPKTLKGLAQVAKKFGIEISKISIEEIKPDLKVATKSELIIESKKDIKNEQKTAQKVEVALEVKKETPVKGELIAELKKETPIKGEAVAALKKETPVKGETVVALKKETPKQTEVKSATKTESHVTVKDAKQSETLESDVKITKKQLTATDTEDAIDIDTKPTIKQTKTVATKQTQDLQDDVKFNEQVKTENMLKEIPKEVKSTPLFKAQVKTEITTEQLVNAKINTLEVKTPKQKADDTLKMLLRGDRVTKNDVNMTADFSVATARVIAPTATTDVSKALESLLHGEQAESSSKTDGLNVSKADSFEVKLNEAKQMTKYLSQDVKTAIEDYKSPFTRVKVQLNPQRLGEIDLTVVQRGKNLHISLSSNNAAINALAMNANDLKAQLTNNGINNATLNFSNNSQGSEAGQQGQQQQSSQHERQAKEEYKHFESEEKNEEILNSLEIVVPNYA